MLDKIFLATTNQAKILRFKNLLSHSGHSVGVFTPADFGLEDVAVVETGQTLADNALLKAQGYFGKVDLPILANDTGFWVEGEGLVDAPKRVSLAGGTESDLSQEAIYQAMLDFWKSIAVKNGGQVDAAWVEAFVLLKPDGESVLAESRREVILTDQEFGQPHLQFPVRALYISKITNKPSVLHTPEEELAEMQPVTEALLKLLQS